MPIYRHIFTSDKELGAIYVGIFLPLCRVLPSVFMQFVQTLNEIVTKYNLYAIIFLVFRMNDA